MCFTYCKSLHFSGLESFRLFTVLHIVHGLARILRVTVESDRRKPDGRRLGFTQRGLCLVGFTQEAWTRPRSPLFLTFSLLLRPIRENGQYQVSVGITSARMIWSFLQNCIFGTSKHPEFGTASAITFSIISSIRACAAGIESRSGSLFIRSFEKLPRVGWVHLARVCALS
jgi:hypothetical protein